MKISLCMICGNEAAFITRCLDSAKDAFDELCLVRAVGTQEPDGTISIAAGWCALNGKEFRVEVYFNLIPDLPHVDDFSAARNLSFSLATGDWLIWLDCDDLIPEGHCAKIRKAAGTAGFDALLMPYDKPDGSTCDRERLIRRGAGRWENRVHEICRFRGTGANTPDIRIIHSPPKNSEVAPPPANAAAGPPSRPITLENGEWLLPTRRRIPQLKKFFAACKATKISTAGFVLVNAREYYELKADYDSIELPPDWHIMTMLGDGMGEKLREFWSGKFKPEGWLGLLVDDLVPETTHWDRALIGELEAGAHIVSCNDGPFGAAKRLRLCGAVAWTTTILRAVGFPGGIYPEGLWHTYIDDIWETIGRAAGCWKIRMDVVVPHETAFLQSGQTAGPDETHQKAYGRNDQDKARFEKWKAEEMSENIAAARALMPVRPAIAKRNASHARNLTLLKLEMAPATRTLFYYHEELFHLVNSGQDEHRAEAVATGKSALQMFGVTGFEERYEIMLNLGELEKEQAEEWWTSAIRLQPWRREAFAYLCQRAIAAGDASSAVSYLRMLNSLPRPNPLPWTHREIWYGWAARLLRVRVMRLSGRAEEADRLHAAHMKSPAYARGVQEQALA